MGIDASGNRLDAAMPHFAMTRADADYLAYLKKLSPDRDPGIADGSVRVGVLLPSDHALAGQAAAIQSALRAYSRIGTAAAECTAGASHRSSASCRRNPAWLRHSPNSSAASLCLRC